jgi:biopolymer transport protein ExbD
VYADVAAELEQLARGMRRPGGKPVSVVLDLDGYVPYEHAIGLVNALQRLGLHDIEWAGNPRFDRYYGR